MRVSPNGNGTKAENVPISDVLAACGGATLGEDPPAEAVEAFLRELASYAGEADPIRRETLKSAAVRELKQAKVQGATSLVKAAFGAVGQEESEEEGLQGRAMVLADPEPWPDPVEGAEVLAEIVRTFTRFVALPTGTATALALWTLHAHTHAASAVSPILSLTSPEKRCGKTTTLYVLGALVPRPLSTANITAAGLFRAIDRYSPTLLIDEADTFLDEKEELRGVLNSGHSRAGAIVVRTAGDDHEVRTFSTWCPKAIAKIGRLAGTLADRSIPVQLRRRAAGEETERLRLDRLHELEPVRQHAARWAEDHRGELVDADPDIPAELHDRAADNWRPLLAIADLAGGPWPERARRAARLLSGVPEDGDGDESPGVQLLRDLHDLFEERGVDRLASARITEALGTMEDRPWPEWRKGKAITERQVAKLLEPFGIKPKQLRFGPDETRKGYQRDWFADSFARYLASPGGLDPKQAKQSSTGADSHLAPIRNVGGSVSDGQSAESPRHAYDVSAVSDRIPEAGSTDSPTPDELFLPEER